MHRISRFVALAGVLGTLVAGLAAGPVAAAGNQVVGHVYVNNNSAGTNTIAGFDRHQDGSLTPIPGSPFAAGGAGTGAPFGSAGGLQRSSDGRYLLATDPGSDQLSVLRIKPNGRLQIAEVVSSNGRTPTSIAVHGSLVYVANGGAGGSNYTGFRLNAGGHLSPIPGSTFVLPDDALPGHVLISPDGRRLVGTRVGRTPARPPLTGSGSGRTGDWSPLPARRSPPSGSARSARRSRRSTGTSCSSRTPTTARTPAPCRSTTSRTTAA